jgi:hypothetical protein
VGKSDHQAEVIAEAHPGPRRALVVNVGFPAVDGQVHEIALIRSSVLGAVLGSNDFDGQTFGADTRGQSRR